MTFTPTRDPHRTTREVEKSIYNQLVEYNTYPMYYIVVSYTTRGKSDIEKYNYKRLNHIHSTHKLIRRKLKEHFNPDIINMINIREARRTVLLDYNMLNLINMAIDRYDEISHENKKSH